MKKVILLAHVFVLTSFLAMPISAKSVSEQVVNTTRSYLASTTSSGIVFRTTQRLRSSDGGEIYLYASGKCELFDGDRLVAACTYTIVGNEVRLLDGNVTLYKGTFRYSSDHRNVDSLTLAGITYHRR